MEFGIGPRSLVGKLRELRLIDTGPPHGGDKVLPGNFPMLYCNMITSIVR